METDDLTIYPVQDDPNRPQYRKVHENLLKPPFRMGIVGASKSGKSNYFMNLIARSAYYGGDPKKRIDPVFDKIIVFSPNLGLDSTTRALRDIAGEENMLTDYHDSYIDQIINHQKDMGDERPKTLIIADDLLALGASPVARLFTQSSYARHLDISIIYITQVYQGHYSLPPVVKNNLEGVVMFRSPSQRQINCFCDDLGGTFGSKNNVRALMEFSTKKPYHFCFFNYADLKVYHNHDDHLWNKFDENGNYSPDFSGKPLMDSHDCEDSE